LFMAHRCEREWGRLGQKHRGYDCAVSITPEGPRRHGRITTGARRLPGARIADHRPARMTIGMTQMHVASHPMFFQRWANGSGSRRRHLSARDTGQGCSLGHHRAGAARRDAAPTVPPMVWRGGDTSLACGDGASNLQWRCPARSAARFCRGASPARSPAVGSGDCAVAGEGDASRAAALELSLEYRAAAAARGRFLAAGEANRGNVFDAKSRCAEGKSLSRGELRSSGRNVELFSNEVPQLPDK